MKTANRLRLVIPAALAALLPLAGCMSAEQHRSAVDDQVVGRLTVGNVQREIRAGMTGADVATVLGAPNIVTTDDQRREVWIYDKIAREVVSSSSGLSFSPLVLATGSILGAGSGTLSQSAGATSHTDRTLTIIIKFDDQKRVRDYAYHASQF